MALAAFLAQVWNTILAVVKQIWGFIRDSIIAPIIAAKDKVVEVVTGIYNSLVEKFNAALTFVRDVWGKIKDAIVKPFEEAKAAVERIAQQIKEAADKINPFHRESPSLVDNVRAGVKAIEDAYAGLGMNLNGPSIAQAGIGVGNGGNIVNISLAGANITDPSIAEDYAEIIGDKIIDKLTRSVRT
jgi:phage-related protein